MDWAIDQASGVQVHAKDGRRHRKYLCPNPTCRKRTHWRGGQGGHRAHFAHWPGVVGQDTCEDYYPPQGSASTGASRVAAEASPLPIHLAVPQPDERFPYWEVRIVFPESLMGLGTVTVDCGLRGTQRVSLPTLAGGGISVPVVTQTEDYRLVLSDGIEDESRRRLERPIPGLSLDVPSAFRYAESGGRRLPTGVPLYWARGYYLVWNRSSAVTPPGGLRWWRPLQVQRDWCAAEIEFPQDPDETISGWVDRLLERRIEHPPISITLVAPADGRPRGEESLAIPEGKTVILGIVGAPGSRFPDDLSLLVSGPEGTKTLPLKPRPQQILLQELPLGEHRLELGGLPESALTLSVTSDRGLPSIPAPRFTAQGPKGDESIPFHCERAGRLLGDLLAGKTVLMDVDFPRRLRIMLEETLPSGASPKRSFQLDDSDGVDGPEAHVALRKEILATLNSSRERGLRGLLLDAGPYGRIGAPTGTAQGPSDLIDLPESLLNSIRWLMTTREAVGHVPSRPVPLCQRIPPRRIDTWVSLIRTRTAECSDLMRCFLQIEDWPLGLHAQVLANRHVLRSVLAGLRRTLSSATSYEGGL